MDSLGDVAGHVVACRRCPRLVEWREWVAVTKRAAYADEEYWGRPVPGFGDERAAVVVVGLAPAAHGANRTGRLFTGDRSGDWLFSAMHHAGLASQPTSTSPDDGLQLGDAYVTSAVKCAPPANKPDASERAACAEYLEGELALVRQAGGAKVVVCLGALAFDAVARHEHLRPLPRFGHGVEVNLRGGAVLLGSYHPSQQNTFTGRLTMDMLVAVFRRAVELAAGKWR